MAVIDKLSEYKTNKLKMGSFQLSIYVFSYMYVYSYNTFQAKTDLLADTRKFITAF